MVDSSASGQIRIWVCFCSDMDEKLQSTDQSTDWEETWEWKEGVGGETS